MFATLLGALPRPTIETDDTERLVEAAVRAQEAAGLEPITDGRLRDLSAHVDDISGATIGPEGQARLAALDPASLFAGLD